MSYDYSHIQQGYTGAGGVPYNKTPSLPLIVTSSHMEEHLPAIASAIYTDMNRRNTKVTNYLANAMAVNTYHNETFTLALQLSADYVEYLMGAKAMPLPQAINTAVPLVNDYICYNYVSQAPNAREMASQQELSTYSVAMEKIKSLKPEIKNYLTRGANNMYPQYPNQQFGQQPPMGFQPQPMQGYPQYPNQGFVQQQPPYTNPNNPNGAQALLSRALARSTHAAAPQQPMQQPYYQQPVYQQGYPQYPNQGFVQQPQMGYQPNMQTAQVVQQVWGQPQMQQPVSQPYNPAAFAANVNTQNPVPSPRQPIGNYPASVQNAGNIWTANPNIQNNNVQQQPSQTRSVSQPYIPDFSSIPRLQQPTQPVQPVQQAAAQPVAQPAPNFAQQVKQAETKPYTGYRGQPSPPGTLTVDRDLIVYENKIREFAKEKGLPWADHSVEGLEWAIMNMYPDNGFIDPNNPFRLRCMPKQENAEPIVSQQEVSPYIQRNADDDLKSMASKSKGELVRNANGDYVWLKEAGNPNSAVNQVNVTSAPQAIKNHVSNGNQAPYPFAKLNSKGQWFITEEEFYRLPKEKRPAPYDGTIARCLMRSLYFIVDNNGKVVKDFSVIKPEYQQEYEELMMNKQQHDYNRFFTPLTKRDMTDEIDYNQAIDAFVNAQTQSKVTELIEKLEKDSNAVRENGVLQISDITLQANKIVSGEIMGDDYVSQAQNVIDDLVEDKAEMSNCAVRFVHANLSGQLQSGDVAQIAKTFQDKAFEKDPNKSTTWEDILDVFNELDLFANTGILTVLNERATNFINQQLISRFNIYPTEFYMESFMLDILDVKEAMEEKGLARHFNQLANKLVLSLLYCFDKESNVFKAVIGDTNIEAEGDLVAFGIVRDITVLPIHSNYISLNAHKRRAVVTESSAPHLYRLIQKTLDTAHPRAAEVMFVTTDNRIMYLNRTVNNNAFAVTQQSVLERTVL